MSLAFRPQLLVVNDEPCVREALTTVIGDPAVSRLSR